MAAMQAWQNITKDTLQLVMSMNHTLQTAIECEGRATKYTTTLIYITLLCPKYDGALTWGDCVTAVISTW